MSRITLDLNNNSLDVQRIDIDSSYEEDHEVKAVVKSFEGTENQVKNLSPLSCLPIV